LAPDNFIKETEIINKIDAWFKKFVQSPQLNKIDFPARYWSRVIIGYFGFSILLEKGVNLANWDHYAVRESTQQLMNLEISDEFNDYIPQVLTVFLSFLEQNTSLPANRKLSEMVKNVSPQKSSRKNNKRDLKLFEISESENKLLVKINEHKKVKKWLKEMENNARNKIFVETKTEDIFSFADVIFYEQQNEVQEFYIYSDQKALQYNGNPETQFFEVLSDFTLMLDWPLKEEKTIIDLYYEQQKEKLSEREAELIAELRKSYLGIYHIKQVNSASYILEDIFSEEEIELRAFGLDLSSGKFLICRLVRLDSHHYNVGPTVNISQETKFWLMDKIKSDLPGDGNRDDTSDSVKNYIKNNPVEIVAVLNSIDSEAETTEIADIFQARFNFQNRKVVYNRLNSVSEIADDEDTVSDGDIFYLSESGANGIQAILLLYEDYLLVRTSEKEMLEKAIDFIKQQLSFAVNLENQEIINISPSELAEIEDWGEDIRQKAFWETAIEIGQFGEKTPQELIRTEEGREIVIMCLEYLELMNYFDHPQAFLNNSDIAEIREELDMTVDKENVLQDGVEKLIVNKNSDLADKEKIIEYIMLWRQYKAQANKIRGRDKSLAAAVEYLIRSLDFDQVTQKEVGNKYGVSPNTISQKYNIIAEELDIYISRGVPSLIPDLDKFFDDL